MARTKILVLRKSLIADLAIFGGLIAIATLAPLIKSQTITGPIVNATLFIASSLLGIQGAILIGLAPSLIALAFGLLPAPLFPMIPYIMTANAILVLVFGALRKKNYWLGVISASILKFLFLFSASSLIVNLLLKQRISSKIAVMMSWPQLFTAIAGGIIAYLFLKPLQKLD